MLCVARIHSGRANIATPYNPRPLPTIWRVHKGSPIRTRTPYKNTLHLVDEQKGRGGSRSGRAGKLDMGHRGRHWRPDPYLTIASETPRRQKTRQSKAKFDCTQCVMGQLI